MANVNRYTLLQYLPKNFNIEESVNPLRIFLINKKALKNGYIVYLCERELRLNDNFALRFAIRKSNDLNLPLKIIHPRIIYNHKPKQKFIDSQLSKLEETFNSACLDFEIINNLNILDYLIDINTSVLIIDFNPMLNRKWLTKAPFTVYEADGHNIVPARFVSDKQEYSASTFRRKIYYNIYPFLTEFKNLTIVKNDADNVLEDFICNKLPYYSEFKNNPNKNVTSDLSKFLNLGFISSQRVALEIIKSNNLITNKEAFLEELIIRKELADNFCLYCKNYKTLSCMPDWSRKTLLLHKQDLRYYDYSTEELEKAETHDILWNATQKQLIKEGKIHGYLRMYWAKKIAEWTVNPTIALDTAIYLNDKFALDSPSPNGYVGILWAIAGLHDRAFADWEITGKIRRMSFNSMKNKFNINAYINKYA